VNDDFWLTAVVVVVVEAEAAGIPPPLSEQTNRGSAGSYYLPALTCCTYLDVSSVTIL